MTFKKMRLAALGLVAALGLSACTDGYGYSGVNVGYGGGYGDYYGDGYYDGYGGGYGGLGGIGLGSYYGWYGNYYYPGTGYYVYGRDRQRYRWNDGQRRYWEGRRGNGDRNQYRDNWQGFDRDRGYRDGNRDGYRGDRSGYRGGVNGGQYRGRRGTDGAALQGNAVTREQYRAERQATGQTYQGRSNRDQVRGARGDGQSFNRGSRPNGAQGMRGGGGRRQRN